MKVLVTAGSTKMMIDQVRCITNIFKGRTGLEIALQLQAKYGAKVTLLSNVCWEVGYEGDVRTLKYRTYDELYNQMRELITGEEWDVIIHSAAVSDYKVEGTYVDEGGPYSSLKKLDSSGKVGSNHGVLYLKMVPTEKIIDRIRGWGFKGKLVKFKLQVGMTDKELIEVAKKSREHSDADIIVANCLEWCGDRAFVITEDSVQGVTRNDLPHELVKKLKEDGDVS